jgi:8-oxo-dGTP pyrophosphatase MutT (NUDIX family)
MSEINPDENPPRPAATLIVVRDNPGAMPSFLMTERSSSMRFAAGAWVFPGGAVDDADRAHAGQLPMSLDLDDLAARIAAVRETVEECGLVLALRQAAPQQSAKLLRTSLGSGAGFATAAIEAGLAFDFDVLVPFARWCPPPQISRRFDTRFYIAVAGEGHDAATPDGTETARLAWLTAGEVLDRANSGAARIIFPTRRNLERLSQFASAQELVDHARAHPVELISPWIEKRDGRDHLCIPEGLGYPVTSEPIESATRA